MTATDSKRYFLLRLVSPRPTFPGDITPVEAKAMQEHVAYWSRYVDEGIVLVLGPVADPKGTWGMGVVAVDDAAEVGPLCDGDPVIRAGLGFRYEVLPMPRAIVRR